MAYEALTTLAAVGKLVKRDGYYKLGCKSDYRKNTPMAPCKALRNSTQIKLVSKIVEPTMHQK